MNEKLNGPEGESGNEKWWAHAPRHDFSHNGAYMVTSGTYRKSHFFRDMDDLKYLHDRLLYYAGVFGWTLEAWAVFSNHYHFIGRRDSVMDGDEETTMVGGELRSGNLRKLVGALHFDTAKYINWRQGETSRKIWHNYWDSRLTYERSYLARLKYVHQNPVHHSLVPRAENYPWCSAAWFYSTASRAKIQVVNSFPIDRLHVPDDF